MDNFELEKLINELEVSERKPTLFLVGPNGAGKSRALRELSLKLSDRDRVLAISNSIYDRFIGVSNLKKMSASNGSGLPSKMIKAAIAKIIDESILGDSAFSSILNYCGYVGAIGLRFHLGKWQAFNVSEYDFENIGVTERDYDELFHAIRLLERINGIEIAWLNFDRYGDSFQSSFVRQYLLIIKWESALRKLKLLKNLNIYLKTKKRKEISIRHATSGQLTLFATVFFLATNVREGSIVLIDEPENSLHPQWQKDFIETIEFALGYNNTSIAIATHSPLLVSGALESSERDISVFQVDNNRFNELDIKHKDDVSESVEEILWQAFQTLTPANHFLSQNLSKELESLNKKKITFERFEELVKTFRAASFDKKQKEFLDAVLELGRKTGRLE